MVKASYRWHCDVSRKTESIQAPAMWGPIAFHTAIALIVGTVFLFISVLGIGLRSGANNCIMEARPMRLFTQLGAWIWRRRLAARSSGYLGLLQHSVYLLLVHQIRLLSPDLFGLDQYSWASPDPMGNAVLNLPT